MFLMESKCVLSIRDMVNMFITKNKNNYYVPNSISNIINMITTKNYYVLNDSTCVLSIKNIINTFIMGSKNNYVSNG